MNSTAPAGFVCGSNRATAAILIAGALMACSAPAWCQTTQPATSTLSPPPSVQQITLEINKSLVLEFAKPIKRAAIADEDQIASIRVISPKQAMITGKTFGFTQLTVWDEQDKQKVYDVRVDINLERLERTLQDAAPRAKIKVSSILDTVILSGVVPDAPTAARLIELARVFASKVHNQLQLAGVQQVLLRATVAEVSRQAVRELGLNGTFFGAKAFGGSNVNSINPTSIGLQERTLLPIGTPNQFQIVGGDLLVSPFTTLYFGLPRAQLELFLQAMHEDNLLRVLAEPSMVTISGHEAEFLAGGEYPVPTPTEDGIAITFREYGVRLKFRPVVQAGQMIRVDVTCGVSEPDYTNAVQIVGLTIPGLTKRIAQVRVEVGSGQTFAIAGLLSESVRGITNKVPGIGSLPVLGALFRSVSYERSETELVILVTPELACPLNPDQVSHIPGRGDFSPNDWQLYGLGMLEGNTKGHAAQAPEQPPDGEVKTSSAK